MGNRFWRSPTATGNVTAIGNWREESPQQIQRGDKKPQHNQQPDSAVFHHADGKEFPIHISLVC